jgi:putative tricarboxylic transport membrane protein
LLKAEKVTGLLLILFALFVILESRRYPLGTIDNPGPGFLPLLLGVAMAMMSVALSARVWKKRSSEASRPFWPERGELVKVTLAFVVILLFTILLEITGYMINIFFLFLILLRPIGRQKWTWSIAISLGATGVCYLLFEKWLMIPLPRGIWLSQ